jgi:hypothetical protein
MANIYISSTYGDLADHRRAVAEILRKLGHSAVAMEDYVAADQRPLDKCLADVAACDIYIGIFAWRYGYVPEQGNPDQKSITELEYRKAVELKKPRLLFLLEEGAHWSPPLMDAFTGDNQQGQRIKELRAELVKELLAGCFSGTDQLAALVSAAVARWFDEQRQQSDLAGNTAGAAHPLRARTVTSDALLAYSAVDQEFSFQLANQLTQNKRKLGLSDQALFAEQEAELRKLDQLASQSHTAVVVLSDATLNQMEEQRERTRRNLEIMRMRAGVVVAICRTAASLDRAAAWNFGQLLDASAWTAAPGPAQIELIGQLDQAIAAHAPAGEVQLVGLPFIVIAMTRAEAQELKDNPAMIKQELGGQTYNRFKRLRTDLERAMGGSFVSRYGEKRELWRPFVGSDFTIQTVIDDTVNRMNQAPFKWRIKPQYYSFDAVMQQDLALHHIYYDIAQRGCIAVVDEFSAFHPRFIAAHTYCPMLTLDGVALVTMSPLILKPAQLEQRELLEQELRSRLTFAFNRFDVYCDPQCEFSVRDARRLKRWLHSSLSQTLDHLETPRYNRRTIQKFQAELDDLENRPPPQLPSFFG